jgi:hypothetical protein
MCAPPSLILLLKMYLRKNDMKYLIWALLPLLVSCGGNEQAKSDGAVLFEKVSAQESHFDFTNTLSFDTKFNIYTYRNFYNGGGVGLADINNDGLLDIYMAANMQPNKLFLNKGNMVFEDITERAGVAGTRAWSTGVTFADVNGDGWTDLYVCNSGDVEGDDRENELFINNRDLTFKEMAAEYGIADRGFSTHAVFFDYDRDDDLDLYVLNNSYQSIGSFNLRKNERVKRDSLGGHKFFRNDGGHFVDVSEKAGIYGSVIAFGLGVTVGDINKDGWSDIYVSNDFFERDYLYINNHDGTFRECLPSAMKSISGASMGADLADLNNDAFPDLFVTEMLPSENSRIKTVTTFENWDRYQYAVSNDYYHQFTRNMLQVNNHGETFSEVGRLAQVEATDWSWGALIFDADNDGLKDIFVASGIYQDLTNQDFLQYASSEELVKMVVTKNKVDYKKLIEVIPSNPVPNHFFKNAGSMKFQDSSKHWIGLDPGFSNGSAYGDLDNDGDLDLVVNKVNMPSQIYRNRSEKANPGNHFLKFVLKGKGKNTQGVGARITLINGGRKYYLEQMPMRGFESTVDHRPNFGVGSLEVIEQVIVEWPDGKTLTLDSVKTNQTITLEEKEDDHPFEWSDKDAVSPLFTLVEAAQLGVDFKHTENQFVDFDRDRLIYHMVSTEGPKVSVADVNKDGRADFYIGGAKEQAGSLFVMGANGKFSKSNQGLFDADMISEDLESSFVDVDGDKDLDLYVCSGGNEYSAQAPALQNRLYINDGRGNFKKSPQLLPTPESESTSTVKAADFDADGDLDLFVGTRLKPFSYGTPVHGFLLVNDGKGNYKEEGEKRAPALRNIGMITDSQWIDVDNDKDPDLVIVGEWMGIRVLMNDKGTFAEMNDSGLAASQGWWNCLEAADLDHDGDIDLIAGNHGLNSRFRASADKPVSMWVGDFDQNGTIEQIICTYNGDKSYPMVLKHDLLSQIPSLKKKFLKYESYKDATIQDIFSPEQLAKGKEYKAKNLATSVLINDGKGRFTMTALPVEAQFSPVYGILADDLDKDGHVDLLLGGNLYKVKPEVGRYDASFGTFLRGDGKGNFKTVANADCGLKIDGEVRDIRKIHIGNSDFVIVARNNDTPLFLKLK